MPPKIALITVLADDVTAMVRFYQDAFGFQMQTQQGDYVEFFSEGVRFSICSRAIMEEATHEASFRTPRSGQAFELAFPVAAPADVDRVYAEILARGARPVQGPADMPWRQRTAFFADPEGNIHELFADLPQD